MNASQPNAPDPHSPTPKPARNRTRAWLIPGLLVAIVVVAVLVVTHRSGAQDGPRPGVRMGGAVPVSAAPSRREDVPMWISALGTVTARNLVNVMPRVSGLLQSVNYREGQMVKSGQVLAVIDPRPFRIAVEQARGQLLRDEAQLVGARRDLARYKRLLAQNSIAAQQVDDEAALVAQYAAATVADRAVLDNAKLNLAYTRITAPMSGLAGLRPVDPGNMVTPAGVAGQGAPLAGGSTAGGATPIVTLAQVQPITVTFALPQKQIGPIVQTLLAGRSLPVEAWDAQGQRLLATGRLLAADNALNTATGTLTFKAEFANTPPSLYPNQFVNIRLREGTLHRAVVVPSTALAVGAPGTYVYVVGRDHRVAVRKVTPGVEDDGQTVIRSGLGAGEWVVTDGLDRLRAGARVRIVAGRGQDGTAKPRRAPRTPRAKPGTAG
ncbi:MAG: efflux RND transporter periplasmic adaptor subunit [Betaproteobacteria bacterium]|nr:efflux RND transporter periplasmic adaptor subunit [Betaproteobacteria bacterium]